MNQDESGGQYPPLNNSRQLQIVQAGSAQFGIYAEEIATIVPWQNPAPLPHAPATVLGVVSIQGRMLTVLDLESLTAGESTSGVTPRDHSHIIALRGDEQLAIAVEAPGEVLTLTERDLLPKPASTNSLVRQVLQLDNAEIGILDTSELFPAALHGRERRRRRF